MTHADDILAYLWSISPESATNGEIARALNIRSHQVVYLLTQDLSRRGLIRAEKVDGEWLFSAADERIVHPAAGFGEPRYPPPGESYLDPREFEALARAKLGEHYGTDLSPGMVPGVSKTFDLVSADRQIVGDAKYYSIVKGAPVPSAKFATVSESVWLLEKTKAPTTFLVFGNDRQVPIRWLERYGNLASAVTFLFLHPEGRLEQLG